MIRFLSLPCGPRSAPYRVLVEITGINLTASEPPGHSPYVPANKHDRRHFQTDEAYADYLSKWQASEIARMDEHKARAAQHADRYYRNTYVGRGANDHEECWNTHATVTEIESALINATGPIAIVTHAYPTEPA